MSKTHNFISQNEHKNMCPKLTKQYNNTQICDDCLITKEVKTKIGKWIGVRMYCDLNKFNIKENKNDRKII